MRRLGMNDGSCNENMPGLPGPLLSNIPQFAAQPIRLEVIVVEPQNLTFRVFPFVYVPSHLVTTACVPATITI